MKSLVIKPFTLQLVGLSLGLLALAPAALANPNGTASQLGIPSTETTSDEIVPGLDVNTLMHQVQRMGGMSSTEFQDLQERRLNSAADAFRQQQQEALRQQSKPDQAAELSAPSDQTGL